MRTLPPDLKAKIEAVNQTIYNNADPKIEAVITKAVKSIDIQTLPTSGRLGSIDIAARRDDPAQPPTELWLIAIVDGEALVYQHTVQPEETTIDWGTPTNIGPARDAAIEFDGSFIDGQFVTFGEPWFFRVIRETLSDKILARQGLIGADVELLNVPRD